MAAPESPETAPAPGVDRVQRARAAIDAAKGRAKGDSERRARDRARDEELVKKAREGDPPSFKRLVELHQSRLFAVAFGILRDRDDAMDVVQDAFIKAHRKLGEFEGNSAFSTWLHRICVNLCIDKKRSDARRKKVDLDDAVAQNLDADTLYGDADITPKLSGTNPLKNATSKEIGGEINRALSGLTEDHRAILLLREVEGMSYEEIAETLGVPKGTVMSRLFHARKNAQRLLRPFLGLAEGEGLGGEAEDAKDGEGNGAGKGRARRAASSDATLAGSGRATSADPAAATAAGGEANPAGHRHH